MFRILKKPRFRAYVVLPLHPEGSPSHDNVQEVLFWQRRTIHMMYTR